MQRGYDRGYWETFMRDTIRTSYQGWHIVATCLKHDDSNPQAERRFTARAFAVLPESEGQDSWRDAGTQTTSIVNRIFLSAAACSDTLVTQMKEVIDNLRTPLRPPLD